MAHVVKDRVMETTSSTGTGTITLGGAATGFQSFSVIGNGNTTYYTIVGGTEWEVGIGTYTASGTTLSRDTVLESSNSGSLVNFSAGTKNVFVTYPAEESVDQDTAMTLTNKTISADNNTLSGIAASSFVLSNASGNIDGSAAQKAIPAGVVVGTTDSQTLTNKTISGASNTLSNIGNSSLTNSAITINGTSTSLGGSINVGTVTSVSGTGSYGGLSLSGTVTSSGNITFGGTPTGTWPISVSGNADTATTATNWGTYGGVPTAGNVPGANGIARADVNGYTYLNYINSNTSNSENPTVSQVIVTNGVDNFYRKASIAHLTSSLSGTAPIAISGNAATATKLSTASGSAPSYSARAWVNFNGIGTVSIRASGNVSSITDNGTGSYTLNYSTAMPDTNYATVTGFGGFQNGDIGGETLAVDGGATNNWQSIGLYSTTQTRMIFAVTITEKDLGYVFVAVFR